jgi:hypothetical protein
MHSSDGTAEERQGRATAVLLVAEDGIAASRVEAALTARGHTVVRASPRGPDLFSSALGQQAIVFVPSRNLLAAQLGNGDGRDPIDETLSATRAPGVELLVVALPHASGFDPMVEAIERHGKPYLILRTPGLLEELAETIRQGEGTLWLPRTGSVRMSRASALADAVAAAIETDEQGRVTLVPSESFDVAGVFDAAARSIGGQVRVHGVSPLVYRMVRPVARWLKGGEPPPLAFADRLLARPASPASNTALAS